MLGRASVLTSVISILPSCCFAWGVEGHQIVAHIAARELTSAARVQVQDLLGGDAEGAMVEVSTWADEIRRARPNTAPWHFVDIPVGSAGYDPSRDCRNDRCIVAQIEREETILADRQLAPPVRAEALRFLIHFVGDIHQPLHAADNRDRGGNGVHVILGRRRETLHAVWDVDVVRALGRSPEDVAAVLARQISPADRRQWERGTARNWANESFQIADAEIYAKLPGSGSTEVPISLPASYAESEKRTVSTQLEKAGIRLSWVLNTALR